MSPELNQLPLNNCYSVVIHLHPYHIHTSTSFFQEGDRGPISFPAQGNRLYFSYMGDSNSLPAFHSLHWMGPHPKALRGSAIHVFLVILIP